MTQQTVAGRRVGAAYGRRDPSYAILLRRGFRNNISDPAILAPMHQLRGCDAAPLFPHGGGERVDPDSCGIDQFVIKAIGVQAREVR